MKYLKIKMIVKNCLWLLLMLFSMFAVVYADGPVITLTPEGGFIGGNTSVTISCSHSSLTLYYQIKPITEDFTPGGFQKYENPISVMPNNKIKVVALDGPNFDIGMVMASKEASYPAIKTASPSIEFIQGAGDLVTVSISNTDPNAKIYYSFRFDDDIAEEYTGPFNCHGRVYIRAQALKEGSTPSDIVESSINLDYTETPFFDTNSHEFSTSDGLSLFNMQYITLPKIYYRINGSGWSLYTGRLNITETSFVEAYAEEEGLKRSGTASITLTKVVQNTTASPSITFSKGSVPGSRVLEIKAADEDTEIFFTMNGETPSLNSEFSYTQPVVFEENVEIKAVALKGGYKPSEVVSSTYNFNRIEMPSITPGSGLYQFGDILSVVMEQPLFAKIYYTLDGTIPTVFSALYDSPIEVRDYTILNAFAVMEGYDESYMATAQYQYPVTIQISPEAGMYEGPITVAMTLNHPKLNLYYELSPGNEGQDVYHLYKEPFIVQPGTTVTAYAVEGDYVFGDNIRSKKSVYYSTVKTKKPVITPVSGTYEGQQLVTMTTDTQGAQIYYGVGPENAPQIDELGQLHGILYEGAFNVTVPCKIFALAIKEGLPPSDLSVVEYKVPNRAPVVALGPDYSVTITSGSKKYVALPWGDVYDLDGDELNFFYELNGSAEAFEHYFESNDEGGGYLYLPIGDYALTLTASDGKLSNEDTVIIHVLDGEAPHMTYTVLHSSNLQGWYRFPVMVKFSGWDDQSQVVEISEYMTLSTEGKSQTLTGYAIDTAGNRSELTTGPLALDMTPPVLNTTLSLTQHIGSRLSVDDLMTDALSGIQSIWVDYQNSRYGIGESIQLTELGTYTFEIYGDDQADNSLRTTVEIEVIPLPLDIKATMGMKTEKPFTGKAIVRIDVLFDASVDVSRIDYNSIRLNAIYDLKTNAPGKPAFITTLQNGQKKLSLWFDLGQVKSALKATDGIITVTGKLGVVTFNALSEDENYKLIKDVKTIQSKLQGSTIPFGQKLLIRIQLTTMEYLLANDPGGQEYVTFKPLLAKLQLYLNGKASNSQLNQWRQDAGKVTN